MTKIRLLFGLFFLLLNTSSYAQNDCIKAITICGNANLSGLETVGIGVQEIFPSNACSSQENNSIWLRVRFKTGGTFGFVITPESNDLVVDFDFWVYGPNIDCSNMGTAVRCSTTNPLQANLNYNTTGMNDIETDFSEGPGWDGNSFIQWITVNDNDVYYIAVDRPHGVSNFAIEWTGSATFYEEPVVQNLTALNGCENKELPKDVAAFDLTPNAASAIGNQTDLEATFYTSYGSAVEGNNPIVNTQEFYNTTNPQKIYIRLTNLQTLCFTVADFDLFVHPYNEAYTNFTYVTPVCVKGFDPKPILGMEFSTGGEFSAIPQGLAINSETGDVDLSKSLPGKYTITYSIAQTYPNCFIPENTSFNLDVKSCDIPKGVSPNNDGKNDVFDLSEFDVKELTIYNRYGLKLYQKTNYKNEWDGRTQSGKELPDATYYYYIELRDGEKRTGWVYLIREK